MCCFLIPNWRLHPSIPLHTPFLQSSPIYFRYGLFFFISGRAVPLPEQNCSTNPSKPPSSLSKPFFVQSNFCNEYAFPAKWQKKPPFLIYCLFSFPRNWFAFNALALHIASITFQSVIHYFALEWNRIFSSFLQSSILASYEAKNSAESRLSHFAEGSRDWSYWLCECVHWHFAIVLLNILVFSLPLN